MAYSYWKAWVRDLLENNRQYWNGTGNMNRTHNQKILLDLRRYKQAGLVNMEG